MTLSLFLVATATFAVAISACSGGGSHGFDPCCAATGQTEQPGGPGASFAATAPASLYVQPFVYDTASCPVDVVTGEATFASTIKSIGSPAKVGSSGRYTVDLPKSYEGTPVGIRVFDGSTKQTLGIAVFAKTPDATSEGSVLHLEPIHFVNGPGKSTLAAAMFCRMRQTGTDPNVTLADVKASLLEGMPRDTTLALTRAKAYLDAVNELATKVSQGDAAKFASLRETAEMMADVSRDSATTGTGGDLAAMEARFQYLGLHDADVTFADGNDLIRHLQGFVQQANEHLRVANPDLSTGVPFQMFRVLHMARGWLAEYGLRKGITSFQAVVINTALPAPSPTGVTIDDALVTLHDGLENAATLSDIDAAWTNFGNGVNANIQAQTAVDSVSFGQATSNALNDGVAAQNAIDADDTWTHDEIVERLYKPSNTHAGNFDVGTWAQVYNALGAATLSSNDRAALTDVVFYPNANHVNF